MFFLCFVGAKLYAVMFYHYMEFTSRLPPQNLVPYFAMEGPYLLSIGLVLSNIYNAPTTAGTSSEAKQKRN